MVKVCRFRAQQEAASGHKKKRHQNSSNNGLKHHQVNLPTQKICQPQHKFSQKINQPVFCFCLSTFFGGKGGRTVFPGFSSNFPHLGRWVRSLLRSKWIHLQDPIGAQRHDLPSPIPTSSRRSSSGKSPKKTRWETKNQKKKNVTR